MKRYLGVDLHKKTFTVCYLQENGREQIKEFKTFQIPQFLKTVSKADEVAVEATAYSRYFRLSIIPYVARVVVVDPSQFRVIGYSVKKNDLHDATQLALYLSRQMLPETRVMTQKSAQIRSLVGTRSKMVQQRTMFKNKIHNILNVHGLQTKRNSIESEKALNGLLQLSLDSLPKLEIELLVKQIRSLNEGIARIERELQLVENQLPGHQNLTSIKGIGDVSASLLLTIIGDIQDFRSEKQLCAYFGLVPRIHHTGETERYGRITKRGNKAGRTMLVQCSWIAIRYNAILRDFYERLKLKKGSSKAIIATARKLLCLIYLTLDRGIIWDDFSVGTVRSK